MQEHHPRSLAQKLSLQHHEFLLLVQINIQFVELFLDKNNEKELHTPTPDSFLDGITRRCIIEIAKSKGIKVIERKIKPEELGDFAGCFLTGTAAEVTPVSEIEDFKFTVCDVIKSLNDSYQLLVRKKTAA